MYGVVGLVLAGLAVVTFGRFYDVDALAYPVWIAAVLLTSFVASILLRMFRSRRHAVAHRQEYKKTQAE
jgi:hypothetical protein